MSDEWWTPAPIVEAARDAMGGIDLDPASCAGANQTVNAAAFYSTRGLERPWHGRVWCNPPWSEPGKWADKLLNELRAGVASACFIGPLAASDWMERLWNEADYVVMIRGTRHQGQWGGPDAATSSIRRPWSWGLFLAAWAVIPEPLSTLGAMRGPAQ